MLSILVPVCGDMVNNVPTGRYVVPTGRVIATVSIKVPTGSDHNLWNIVLHGNSKKRAGRDPRGNIMILPPVTMEEQITVQRETKARTILLQSLPEDHMADFHHLDDAKDIWLANFKISDIEGLQQADYDRTLEIDVKGGSSYDSRVPAAPTHSAFISAASTNSKWSTADSKCQPSSDCYTTNSSSADASGNVLENVLQFFFVVKVIHKNRSLMKTLGPNWQVGLEETDIKLADGYLFWKNESGFNDKGYRNDAVIPAVDAADGVSSDGVSVAAGIGADGVFVPTSDATDDETQFEFMGLSSQVKLEESEARFDKWKDSSKNLNKLINSSMSSRSKFGLGYGDTFGTDEVFDLSAPRHILLTNKDLGIVDSGCSRSMTGNKEKLADFVKIKGGTVTFGGGDGQIT
ncbi:hypothetical protein Tco_1401092 [Tanacetum coccineum]